MNVITNCTIQAEILELIYKLKRSEYRGEQAEMNIQRLNVRIDQVGIFYWHLSLIHFQFFAFGFSLVCVLFSFPIKIGGGGSAQREEQDQKVRFKHLKKISPVIIMRMIITTVDQSSVTFNFSTSCQDQR